jgi:hypothetical protein
MQYIPHVATLSDYLRIAEAAIVIEMPLADDLESVLLYSDEHWFLIINTAAANKGDLRKQKESS